MMPNTLTSTPASASDVVTLSLSPHSKNTGRGVSSSSSLSRSIYKFYHWTTSCIYVLLFISRASILDKIWVIYFMENFNNLWNTLEKKHLSLLTVVFQLYYNSLRMIFIKHKSNCLIFFLKIFEWLLVIQRTCFKFIIVACKIFPFWP